MPTKTDVIKNLDWVTERVSNRVWSVSVGVLATALAYIIESTKQDGTPFLLPQQVVGPAVVALLALIFDLLQYIAANSQDRALLRRMEKQNVTQLPYDSKSFWYTIRNTAYWVKIIFCFISVLWIVFLSIKRIISLF